MATTLKKAVSSLTSHLSKGGQKLARVPDRQKLSPRVISVLGMNPSPFTLTGTNTYLVGTGKRRILIDTGQGEHAYMSNLERAMTEAGCDGLQEIIITHWHHDHLGGLPDVMSRWGQGGIVPVRKFMPLEQERLTAGEGAIDPYSIWPKHKFSPLKDGETIRTEGATLRIMYTPGHANDHVAIILEEEGSMFTGDNVLGVGTAVISELDNYLDSLQRMADARPNRLYPSHGPTIESGGVNRLHAYIAHRLKRVEQVKQLFSQKEGIALTLAEITRAIYPDLPPTLLGAAAKNTGLVLQKLEGDGNLRLSKDRWAVPQDNGTGGASL